MCEGFRLTLCRLVACCRNTHEIRLLIASSNVTNSLVVRKLGLQDRKFCFNKIGMLFFNTVEPLHQEFYYNMVYLLDQELFDLFVVVPYCHMWPSDQGMDVLFWEFWKQQCMI